MKYLLPLFGILLIACDGPDRLAVVELQPLRDSGVGGEVYFREQGDYVKVTGAVFGLQPNSVHAFHVHKYGDCGNNGENAGDHFNPFQEPHGKFGEPPHHAGDFPQLVADDDGQATIDFVAESFRLTDERSSVIGKALIVHQSHDKYTQPSGDAGSRIACGIILQKD